MPITMSKTGDVHLIRRISGRDETRRHLSELGFVIGAEVTVVSELGGNLILCVKNCRVALSKSLANRIIV